MIKKTIYFSTPAYLSLRMGQVVIKMPEVEKQRDLSEHIRQQSVVTRPIEDVGLVILDHKQITLTQGLIEALLANNCALITCNSQSMPVGLMLPLSGNTTQSERFQCQIAASLPLRKQLWQQTIKAKIRNQAMVLSTCAQVEVGCMQHWAEQVKSGDPDNLEARAAAYYWHNLFSSIAGLTSFTRHREGMPPNNLLNYGYAIMEPFRPYVDELVYCIVRESGTNNLELTKDVKARLLAIPTLDVVISGKRSPLMVGVVQTTASLSKCYSGEVRRIAYPER